jgi:hypothetical protein
MANLNGAAVHRGVNWETLAAGYGKIMLKSQIRFGLMRPGFGA